MRKLLVILVGLMLVTDEGVWCAYSADDTESTARSTTVAAGDSAKKITALGTVEPEEMIDVSAQVAGRIVSLGADPHTRGKPIDFGSVVSAGTVLAQVDSAEYCARCRARAGWV